jgi:hypothetical protein
MVRYELRRATLLTPFWVVLLAGVASGTLVQLQMERDPEDSRGYQILTLGTLVVVLVALGVTLVVLLRPSPHDSSWSYVAMLMLGAVLMAGMLIGPLASGVLRWSEVLTGGVLLVLLFTAAKAALHSLLRSGMCATVAGSAGWKTEEPPMGSSPASVSRNSPHRGR